MESCHDTDLVVAITGANGFIGKKLVAELLKHQSISIRLLVRDKVEVGSFPTNVTLIRGDLTKIESLNDFLRPSCIVINLAFMFNAIGNENLALAKNLVKISTKNNVSRLIHCSTTSVFGNVKEDVVKESTVCNPSSDYAKSKLLIEEILKSGSEDNYEYVSIRPTEVYGANGKAAIKLINNLMYGNQILNYMKSCLFNSRKMNLVHVSNVVAALEFLIQTEKSIAGEVFIVSEDDNPLNNYMYIEKYLVAKLKSTRYLIPVLPFPSFILSLIFHLLRRDSANPKLLFDSSKLKKIGFKYVTSFDRGLDDLISGYQRNLKKIN